MDIEKLNDACGGLAWVSEALFEGEGRLAVDLSAEPSRPYRWLNLLACSSRRHGQHALWWRSVLSDSPALGATDRVRPPSLGWEKLIDAVQTKPPQQAVALLYEVALPELSAWLSTLATQMSPVSDGAAMRTARMVIADLVEEQSAAARIMKHPHTGFDPTWKGPTPI